jgi:hypothetical protein
MVTGEEGRRTADEPTGDLGKDGKRGEERRRTVGGT